MKSVSMTGGQWCALSSRLCVWTCEQIITRISLFLWTTQNYKFIKL